MYAKARRKKDYRDPVFAFVVVVVDLVVVVAAAADFHLI